VERGGGEPALLAHRPQQTFKGVVAGDRVASWREDRRRESIAAIRDATAR
jgi:hypothetical protein